MRLLRYLWLPVVLSSVLLFPSAAAADTIRITSGFLELVGDFDLGGETRGFRLVGRGYGGSFGANARVFCEGAEEECNPGDSAVLQHAHGGLDLFVDRATIDGVTHTDVNSLNSVVFAEIGFLSRHVLPPANSTAILRDPFTMEGAFTHPGGLETLVGTGIVTTHWMSRASPEDNRPVWDLVLARYDFAATNPVPEPGTLMLAGIAGAAAAFSRRKRRSG